MDTDAALAQVGEGLDAVLATGFDPVDTAEAAGLIRRVEAVARRMHAAQVELLACIDRKGLHRHDGHASAKVMVRHVADLSSAEAARRAQSAAVLSELPAVARAHRSGELGTCQVRRLGRLHANRRVRQHLPASETHLLAWARREPYRYFDQLVGAWEQHVDEDGAGDRESRAQAARDFRSVQNYDRSWTYDGLSPSVDGARINDILAHFARLEWEKDWAEARRRLGDAATEADLARTRAQRRHDAFVAVCHRAAASVPGQNGGGGSGIVTDIVIDHRTLERELAKLAGIDPGPSDPHDPTWRCSTLDGAPIDPTAATLAALAGEVRRVVVGAGSVVVDLGRRRLMTGAAALAVRLADGECLWPGCQVPVSDCQIDHLTPWADGGDSTPANGGPLCGRHNRLKHSEDWCTWRDAAGRWHLRRPDGTTVEGPADPPPGGDTGPSPPVSHGPSGPSSRPEDRNRLAAGWCRDR